jgi:hypothetical protein
MLMDQYVDTQMFNVPMSTLLISICRSELNCQSYMLRKTRNRADISSRVKCVPRLDGVLHDFSPSELSGPRVPILGVDENTYLPTLVHGPQGNEPLVFLLAAAISHLS